MQSIPQETASVDQGFHLSCSMGSYPRHQSYHDCPSRLCLSQPAQPPNQSNILECHSPAFEGGERKKHNGNNKSSKDAQFIRVRVRQPSCALAGGAPWFSGWFTETHGCLSSLCLPAQIKSCCSSCTQISKLFSCFPKDDAEGLCVEKVFTP